MMAELALPVDPASVARHYGDIIDHYVIDEADARAVSGIHAPVTATRTLMETMADRAALARVVIAVGQSL
jgi:LPPG:FO 2-phospho-L-lactate transferase